MANIIKERVETTFNKLDKVLTGNYTVRDNNITHNPDSNNVNSYSFPNGVMTAKNQEEWNQLLLQKKQNKLFQSDWKHSERSSVFNKSIQESNRFNLYQNYDQMDWYPETAAALDIYMDEVTVPNIKGEVLNIFSESTKIRDILKDLFYNRLKINVNLPLWTRMTCKYGDNFCLLNIDDTEGILGIRQLPAYEMVRLEEGFNKPVDNDINTAAISFKRTITNDTYLDFQVAHFRLLTDASSLPYGTSVFMKCIKAWRNLTLAEDAMLVYRLVRAPDRRIYKIYVGNINPDDVPAYIEGITNHFKRSQLVDPQTGQVDLKQAVWGIDQDIFMPIRSADDKSEISTLDGASNMDQVADIDLLISKLVIGLEIPAPFLNFKDVQGGGDLAIQDIRFTRKINRIQQSMLMELNKIAIIHLWLLGYEEEITNFTLSLNNPSNQLKLQYLEELTKQIQAYNIAVTPAGDGVLPAMSCTTAMKEIMGYSNDKIMQILDELRVEQAVVTELMKTNQIIKKTGLFDKVDKIYGEPGATYMEDESIQQSSHSGGNTNIGSSNIDFNAGAPEETPEPSKETKTTNTQESIFNLLRKPILSELGNRKNINNSDKSIMNEVKENIDKYNKPSIVKPISNKFFMNEDLHSMIKTLKNKQK